MRLTPRHRLATLVVAAMSLLAVVTTAETQDLTVTPAALADVATPAELAGPQRPAIDSHYSICYRWRPHTGDTVETSFYYHMDVFVVKVQCVADDPNYTGNHYYCVYVYSSGHEAWFPNCLDGFG